MIIWEERERSGEGARLKVTNSLLLTAKAAAAVTMPSHHEVLTTTLWRPDPLLCPCVLIVRFVCSFVCSLVMYHFVRFVLMGLPETRGHVIIY